MPRTKIVCTLGPATASREALRSLVEAGLNVARINFSHGTHEQHVETIKLIRSVAGELRRPVAVLGDLEGPRIRIGDLEGPVLLDSGQEVVLAPEDRIEHAAEIPVTYDRLAEDLHV